MRSLQLCVCLLYQSRWCAAQLTQIERRVNCWTWGIALRKCLMGFSSELHFEQNWQWMRIQQPRRNFCRKMRYSEYVSIRFLYRIDLVGLILGNSRYETHFRIPSKIQDQCKNDFYSKDNNYRISKIYIFNIISTRDFARNKENI